MRLGINRATADGHSPHDEAGTRVIALLEAAGYQSTSTRRLIADLIAGFDGHFTAADLLARGRDRDPSLGRATVFRTLELLDALHIVERLDLPTGAHAYVLCEPDAHHHHLVCSGCGRSVDVQDGDLARLVDEIARREGFRIEAHRLELFGTCAACCTAEAGANEAEANEVEVADTSSGATRAAGDGE